MIIGFILSPVGLSFGVVIGIGLFFLTRWLIKSTVIDNVINGFTEKQKNTDELIIDIEETKTNLHDKSAHNKEAVEKLNEDTDKISSYLDK